MILRILWFLLVIIGFGASVVALFYGGKIIFDFVMLILNRRIK